MQHEKQLFTTALVALLSASTAAAQLPPPITDAGGDNLPNLGMQHIKQIVSTDPNGILPSGAITMLPNTVPPQNPVPTGRVLDFVNLYLPDLVAIGGDQAVHDLMLGIASDTAFPKPLWMGNSDPSGSLDDTALDGNNDRIHFNLHWPQETPQSFWLADQGFDPASPPEDLEEILGEIIATGDKSRIQEALDILLGTNVSGALTNKVYNGFELLKYKGRRDNQTFDPVTRNIEVTQLWYGTEIYTDANMMKVPEEGDYTITWKVRGLGDPGPNNLRAFPIDEFTPMPMKKTSNSLFWTRNNWIWKWFDVVESHDGRKYSLHDLFEAHTGTALDGQGQAVPTYADVIPGDPRYWLHINRKMDLGSFVGGNGDIEDLSKWQQYDLDLDGQIGGYLVDGTDTGAPWDAGTNPDAQFNTYGNQEYAVPMVDWSQGPYDIPHFAYDSSFATIRKGQGFDVTIRYSNGEMQAGLYNWGWRIHPPRINWVETYSEGQYLASGAPKDWRFGHKWDEVQALGLDALGDFAPEMVIHDALIAYDLSAGTQADIDTFAAAVDGMMDFVHDRRGLPPTPGVVGFPNPSSDANMLMSNLDMWGDRDTIAPAGKKTWDEGDVITITIYNDDNFDHFFRVVDFGTTDYQYNGTDMGRLDWKPVWGFPQIAVAAWSGLFGAQGYDVSFWDGTDIDGLGNPFYVDPTFDDPGGFWNAGQRDLLHHYDDLTGFSGPGFHEVIEGEFTVWGNNQTAGKPTGNPNIWSYSYGKPIPPKTVVTFDIEMPRAQALNNGAMYMFDPQFHHSMIFTMHPRSELEPEGLAGK